MPERNNTFMCYFYEALYFNIDVCRSDSHILAYIYISTMMEEFIKDYNLDASSYLFYTRRGLYKTIKSDAIKVNEKTLHIKKHTLKTRRFLKNDCKEFLESYVYGSIGIITKKNPITTFLHNNSGSLGIFDNNAHKLLLSRPIKQMPIDTIYFAMSAFEYQGLSELQVSSCLISNYLFLRIEEQIERFPDGLLEIVCDRINYWIAKYPNFIRYISDYPNEYCTAFWTTCYLCYLIGCSNNATLKLGGQMFQILSKDNFRFALDTLKSNHNGWPDRLVNKARVLCRAFIRLKLADDYLFINIICNKVGQTLAFLGKDLESSIPFIEIIFAKYSTRRNLIKIQKTFSLGKY